MYRTLRNAGVASAAMLLLSSGVAQATVFFEQGFETDTAGYFDANTPAPNDWFGSVTRVASGTSGITSFAGSFHAIVEQSGNPGNETGPFTRFDGYSSVFPAGGYSTSTAIFLDTGMELGEGFDYSVASSGSDGNHQRDFIFHVTKDSDTGSLLVGGSGNLMFTETRSSAADTIPGEVGGHRYGWFTNVDVTGGIAIDSVQVVGVPEPGMLALFGLGLVGLGIVRRRRAA